MAYGAPAPVEPKKGRLGCSIFGWVVFLLVVAGLAVIGYRVWFYADKLRRGEILDLPQSAAQRSVPAGVASGSSGIYEDPAFIQGQDQPSLGNDLDPKLTIVEFGDFQCPYSKDAAAVVRTVMAAQPGQVRFIYRDLPLASLHPDAFEAALAAECAREQGKFWPYHDKLYANQSALALADLLRYGQEIGLDARQFETCVADNRYKAAVEADLAAAAQAGVSGTPTFFFNGQRVEGLIPADVFEKIVAQLLK